MATLNAVQRDPNEEFRLVKPIQNDVWLAERLSDKEAFIARRLEEFDALHKAMKNSESIGEGRHDDTRGLTNLLSDCGFDRAFAQLLNHENILSLAGVMNERDAQARDESNKIRHIWLVWDYCDGGSLMELFLDRHIAGEHNMYHYMPESFCWHVLRSVMRALSWLHSGRRFFCASSNPALQELLSVDTDWYPILHGAVTPENIFFQLPRGRETYGACKLGNFSKSFVSGQQSTDTSYQTDEELAFTGLTATLRDGKMANFDSLHIHYGDENPTQFPTRKNLYTINEELWNLGSIVYRMMTGHEPPPYRGCNACNYKHSHVHVCSTSDLGCIEVSRSCRCIYGACKHFRKDGKDVGDLCKHVGVNSTCADCTGNMGTKKCLAQPVRIQEILWRKRYSKYLINAVLMLLQPYRNGGKLLSPGWTPRILIDIETLYDLWLKNTRDGRGFYGIDDDLLDRCRVEAEGNDDDEDEEEEEEEKEEGEEEDEDDEDEGKGTAMVIRRAQFALPEDVEAWAWV